MRSLATVIKDDKIEFVTGVPDSKLADDLREIDKMQDVRHIIAVDEGAAVALAAGYHLATGKTGLVYMQSDGLCNALNAITSLLMPYEIPVRFVISHRRGFPQHKVMGEKLHEVLKLFEIEATIV